MAIKLLRCRKCHCTAKLYTSPACGEYLAEAQVVCDGCGAKTRNELDADLEMAILRASTAWNSGLYK